MAQQYLAEPRSPPDLNIPKSTATVKVSVIDSTARFRLPISGFLQPEYHNRSDLCGPSFSFLIEHPSHKSILFDLGVRVDLEKLPSYSKFQEFGWDIKIDKDVASILKDHGTDVDGGAIDAIIWSHHHWDHVGDPSTFPGSTELVVGPGFKAAHMPGYPDKQDSTLLQSDFEGRNVREVDIQQEGGGLKIGRFLAYDYFGDGSFYLLDTPGHSVGHMCGLARTSSSPDSFVFMGGDASHHGGEFRPTEFLPIPKEIEPSPLKRRAPVCPGHLLHDVNPHGSATKPFYYVTKNLSHDKEVADWTVAGLGEFDCHDSILLLLAHDDAVVDPPQLDFYPKSLDGWYEQALNKKVRWLFLTDFEDAVDEKQKGGKAFSWGTYP